MPVCSVLNLNLEIIKVMLLTISPSGLKKKIIKEDRLRIGKCVQIYI